MIRQIALLLLLPVLPAVLLGVVIPRVPSPKASAVPDERHWSLNQILAHENILWIDARPFENYRQEHIPGAMPLDMKDWDNHLPAILEHWRPDHLTVVYCSQFECDASDSAADRLEQEVGLSDVKVLLGGWESWREQQ